MVAVLFSRSGVFVDGTGARYMAYLTSSKQRLLDPIVSAGENSSTSMRRVMIVAILR